MLYLATLPVTKSRTGRRALFSVSPAEEWEFITTKLNWDVRRERSLGLDSRDCLDGIVSMRRHFIKMEYATINFQYVTSNTGTYARETK